MIAITSFSLLYSIQTKRQALTYKHPVNDGQLVPTYIRIYTDICGYIRIHMEHINNLYGAYEKCNFN